MISPTITTGIQAKLSKDEFNNDYKMYQGLKELLQPTVHAADTNLSYQNYGNISEFLDYIKLLEEQIDATKGNLDDKLWPEKIF